MNGSPPRLVYVYGRHEGWFHTSYCPTSCVVSPSVARPVPPMQNPTWVDVWRIGRVVSPGSSTSSETRIPGASDGDSTGERGCVNTDERRPLEGGGRPANRCTSAS